MHRLIHYQSLWFPWKQWQFRHLMRGVISSWNNLFRINPLSLQLNNLYCHHIDAQLTMGETFPESSVSIYAMTSSSSNERHNFNSEQPLLHNFNIPASQQPIRRPHCFHSSSPQLTPSLGQTEKKTMISRLPQT